MEHDYPMIIAIDGPAASGKTTVGRMLAEKLGYLFFDSGLLYRAVTWAAIQQNIACDDEDALILLIDKIDLDVRSTQRGGRQSEDVFIDGEVITEKLHSQEVSDHVSEVARHPKVRMAITGMSRNLGLKGKIVMVGRDIGTVVLPEADLKIYLDASLEERARRRYEEQKSKGDQIITFDEVLQNVRKRDEIDSHRAVSPLKVAEDAIVIQTDGLRRVRK
jgi:cytidylate kinase